MTLGEHLEELRGCVLRSLLSLVLACLLMIWPAKYLLEVIARPVVLALRRHGQPDSFLATGPVESILVYIKVVVIFGLIAASPYILYQLWNFVAVGLYPHERRWVYRIVPASVGLFLLGVLFMYVFALLVSLNFLVGFSGWLPLPRPQPNPLERLVLNIPELRPPDSQPTVDEGARVPLLSVDPVDPPVGALWVNLPDSKLKLRLSDDKTYSVQLLRDDKRALVTTHFRIGQYLSFVLIMTIAFGVAFQMPLVIMFLARTGIVPAETMRKHWRVAVLIIVFIAGLLAPPDLLSHLMLSGPMVLLYVLGLFLAGRRGPRHRTATTEGS